MEDLDSPLRIAAEEGRARQYRIQSPGLSGDCDALSTSRPTQLDQTLTGLNARGTSSGSGRICGMMRDGGRCADLNRSAHTSGVPAFRPNRPQRRRCGRSPHVGGRPEGEQHPRHVGKAQAGRTTRSSKCTPTTRRPDAMRRLVAAAQHNGPASAPHQTEIARRKAYLASDEASFTKRRRPRATAARPRYSRGPKRTNLDVQVKGIKRTWI